MSLRRTIYHIDRGPTDMYPVDAGHALGAHPHEWSAVPWSDEMKAASQPHLEERARRQAEAQQAGVANTLIDGKQVVGAQVTPAGQTGDPKTNAEVVKRLEGELAAAEAEVDRAQVELNDAKKKDDATAGKKAQTALEAAEKKADAARASLAAAKK